MPWERSFIQPIASPRVATGEEPLSQISSSHPPRSCSSNFKYSPGVPGRDRRLERPSTLPRSSTTPALLNSSLSPDSVGINPFISMSQVTLSDYQRDREATTTPTKNPYTPTTSISPSWTPVTTAEGKKKGRILGAFTSKKTHDRERPSSSGCSIPTTPLPPDAQLNSPKAARILGLPPPPLPLEQRFENTVSPLGRAGLGNISGPSPVSSYQADGQGEDNGELSVRKTVRRIASLPWLTRTQEAVESRTHIEENEKRFEGSGSHTTETAFQRFKNTHWKGTNKKALKMLDIMPLPMTSRPKSSGRDSETLVAGTLDVQDEEAEYHSDGEPLSHHRPIPHLTPPPHRRTRRRRKGQKSLERMSPITEASFSDNNYIGADGDNAELEVISEYDVYTTKPYQLRRAYPPPHKNTTAPTLQGPFELGGLEVSGDIPREGEGEERGGEQDDAGEDMQEHPEKQPLYQYSTTLSKDRSASESTPQYYIKSPLQKVEHVLLNNTGKLLRGNTQLRNTMTPEIHRLHESNGEMKRELENIKGRNIIQHASQSYYEDNDDYGSDSNSGDQWVVEEAVPMSFTRITPGTVKVVDIPPTKVKVTGIDSKQAKASKSTKSNLLGVPTMRGGMDQSHRLSPCSPYRSSSFAFQKAKKSKFPREESLNLIEGWITSSASTAQRPFSMRLDPDVLADQNLDRPPTPPPKDSSKVVSEHLVSPKHHCIHNGHLFHAISLQKVPDKVDLNSLQVSPFLVTSSGIKQHIKIPVACDNCGRNIKEEVWECEVPVCKLSVCYDCAVAMEEEWEGRAVKSWSQKLIEDMTV